MRAVAGAAPDAEQEQPPFAFAQRRELLREALDSCDVDGLRDFDDFLEVGLGMHGRAECGKGGL